jgi:hypothetical protein
MIPILLIVAIIVIGLILVLMNRREKEVQIKNVILYITKPIEHKDDSSAKNAFDQDKATGWNPVKQDDRNYILGFDFNQIKQISRVKVISSKTKSYNSINELKIRMPNGEMVYDTAKSIKAPLETSEKDDKVEPQIIDIELTPSVTCDKLLLEFFCDTVNETSCDVREVMFYEKQKGMF